MTDLKVGQEGGTTKEGTHGDRGRLLRAGVGERAGGRPGSLGGGADTGSDGGGVAGQLRGEGISVGAGGSGDGRAEAGEHRVGAGADGVEL